MIKKKKIVSKVISSLLILFILAFSFSSSFRYLICMSVFHVFSPTPEIVSELQTMVKDYNRTCEKGYKVKIVRSNNIGPSWYIDFQFKNSKTDDNNKRISFLLYIHNNFGFSELSCSSDTSKYFNRAQETMDITFDNIELSYGDGLSLPIKLDAIRKDMDVYISSNVIFDFSLLDEFNGVIVFALSGHNDIKSRLKENYSFIII